MSDPRSTIGTIGHVIDLPNGRILVTGWRFDVPVGAGIALSRDGLCGWTFNELRALSADRHRRN